VVRTMLFLRDPQFILGNCLARSGWDFVSSSTTSSASIDFRRLGHFTVDDNLVNVETDKDGDDSTDARLLCKRWTLGIRWQGQQRVHEKSQTQITCNTGTFGWSLNIRRNVWNTTEALEKFHFKVKCHKGQRGDTGGHGKSTALGGRHERREQLGHLEQENATETDKQQLELLQRKNTLLWTEGLMTVNPLKLSVRKDIVSKTLVAMSERYRRQTKS
jgi:hypothetical protein